MISLLTASRSRVDGLEVAEGAGDGFGVRVAELTALGAKGFAHGLPEVDAVDELDAARAVGGLFVGEHPDVGGDARVVEHIGRERDNGFEQVGLQDVSADLGLARGLSSPYSA